MAKSDYGLSASSDSTKMQISREEFDLRMDYVCGIISTRDFNKKLKKMKAKHGKTKTKNRR